MNLYQLRYFVTLAKFQHYMKASEQLCITQPSLSHAISTLEKELGVKLFEKDGRNVILTKCGKNFLKDAEHTLQLLDSSVERLKSSAQGNGRLDIGLLPTLGTDFVPRLIRGFLSACPDKTIDFHFYNGLTADFLEDLKIRNTISHFAPEWTRNPLSTLSLSPGRSSWSSFLRIIRFLTGQKSGFPRLWIIRRSCFPGEAACAP